MATSKIVRNDNYCDVISNELTTIQLRLNTIRDSLNRDLAQKGMSIEALELRLRQVTMDIVQVADSIDVTLSILEKECSDPAWEYRAGSD
jgi:hypothetical protein